MNGAFQTARIVNSRLRNLKSLALNWIGTPVVVLGYHRVAVVPSDRHSLAVSPAHFREHVRYLKRNFRIVRFEEDWSRLREPAVAITFDDGYADNLTEALPILEEVGVPATFFVSSGQLESAEGFYWDELERLAVRGASYPSQFVLKDRLHGRRWSTRRPADRLALSRDLLQLSMRVDEARRADWLGQLRAWSGSAPPAHADRPLTCAELQALGASRLVTIGAHTVSHSSLAALPEEQQAHEITSSKRRLEEVLGTPVDVFSYPFGKRSDYDRTTVALCRRAGYRKAATAFPGHWYRWTDSYQIPRHFIQDFDLDSFVVKVKSFWIDGGANEDGRTR
jgi:peptidoglycan/xylan/chitin deacetylase (PgdA/CDA1 family)